MIHEEVLYQVYVPLHLLFSINVLIFVASAATGEHAESETLHSAAGESDSRSERNTTSLYFLE